MNEDYFNDFKNLEEPIKDTIYRDLSKIILKLRYVLLPFSFSEKINHLRDWDIFGPMVISLLYAIIMSERTNDISSFLSGIYIILIFGSLIVTFNARLLGQEGSVLFFVSILGYCLFPFVIASFISISFGYFSPIFNFISSIIAFAWSIKSAGLFLSSGVNIKKKYQSLYPIILFYLFFVWFNILE